MWTQSHIMRVSIPFTREIWDLLNDSARRRSKGGKLVTVPQLIKQFVRAGLNAEAEAERAAEETLRAERQAAIEARRAANEFRRATSSTTSPYREVGISSVTSRRDPAIESPISETRYAIPSSGEDLRHTLERLKREEESDKS